MRKTSLKFIPTFPFYGCKGILLIYMNRLMIVDSTLESYKTVQISFSKKLLWSRTTPDPSFSLIQTKKTPQNQCTIFHFIPLSNNTTIHLSLASQLQGVAPLPACATGAPDRLGVLVALAQAPGLATSRRQTSQLAVLVDWVAQPVGLGVVADGVVGWVNKEDFEEFVCGVLGHPVRVQHSEGLAATAHSFLEWGKGGGLKKKQDSLKLEHHKSLTFIDIRSVANFLFKKDFLNCKKMEN